VTRPCPTCGGPVQQRWQGRPALYCGTPCRQAAHRARLAAARAAETARWLRASMGSAEAELQRAVTEAFAAVAAVHGLPPPGEHDVPGGFEDEVMRHADAARRAWSRVYDLASDHARARHDCDAARSRGFRRSETSAPVGDETRALPAAVASGQAAEPPGRDPLAEAIEDVLFVAWPRCAVGLKASLTMTNIAAAIDRLYEALGDPAEPWPPALAAAAVVDAAADRGHDWLPAEFGEAVTRLGEALRASN
jgi:hypothetical protein